MKTTSRTSQRQRWAFLPVALSLTLMTAACGSDNNATSKSTSDIKCAPAASVDGAGSTFAAAIVQQWVKDYQAACSGTVVNYKGGGSGAGIQQLTAGTVAFAGSDVPLTKDERTAAEAKYGAGNLVTAPWSAGGIAIEYNIAGVEDLQLAPATLAAIFAGKVTKWNDPSIKSDNPDATLPDKAIQAVHRSDGSGTTAAFTSYLTAVAPTVWTFGSSKNTQFPGGQAAKGSDQVSATVKQTDGAIGYAEVSYAQAASLKMAKIKNAAGEYRSPTDSGAVTAALLSAKVGPDGSVTLDYAATNRNAYPISTVTYLIAPKVSPATPASTLVQSFASYAADGGQSSADQLGYAALPNAFKESAATAIASLGPATSSTGG